jgi:hypothetical protein
VFTLEESALLGRMLRIVASVLVVLALLVLYYLVRH